MRSERERRRGFTLVEMMAVVVIIGILAGIVGIYVVSRIAKAREMRIKSDMKSIEDAITHFQMDKGRYPESLEELVQERILQEMPRDPWGNPYSYERTDDTEPPYTITCYGADGQPGGEGDNRDYTNHELLHGGGEEGGGTGGP
ncbi:MAG: type II secretion system protein GspG [Planctomycetota bacterium]|nr:MAG: type II secretion system protein GspG [Planctomycetota bacterium]